MLCVKIKLSPSPIHGLGLFADQFIPKGTIIWRFTKGFDQRFTREELLKFPKILQIFFVKYSSLSKKTGKYILCADQGNYMNHAENPNTICKYVKGEEEFVTYAVKDIQIREEITEDYLKYDDVDEKDNVLKIFSKKYNVADEINIKSK